MKEYVTQTDNRLIRLKSEFETIFYEYNSKKIATPYKPQPDFNLIVSKTGGTSELEAYLS